MEYYKGQRLHIEMDVVVAEQPDLTKHENATVLVREIGRGFNHLIFLDSVKLGGILKVVQHGPRYWPPREGDIWAQSAGEMFWFVIDRSELSLRAPYEDEVGSKDFTNLRFVPVRGHYAEELPTPAVFLKTYPRPHLVYRQGVKP